jgi:hypothetical protein
LLETLSQIYSHAFVKKSVHNMQTSSIHCIMIMIMDVEDSAGLDAHTLLPGDSLLQSWTGHLHTLPLKHDKPSSVAAVHIRAPLMLQILLFLFIE